MSTPIIYLLGIAIGVLVTVVPIMNGANTKVLGTIKVSYFHYLSAFVTGLVFLGLTTSFQTLWTIGEVPIHYFLGGVLGLSVILLMNYYSVRIKALHIAILPFLGQMTMGLILDYYLYDLLNLKTVLGLSVVLVGLMVQADQKIERKSPTRS